MIARVVANNLAFFLGILDNRSLLMKESEKLINPCEEVKN